MIWEPYENERELSEKLFEKVKSFEEIQPLRHRLEFRVLGIIFVSTLALRLIFLLGIQYTGK